MQPQTRRLPCIASPSAVGIVNVNVDPRPGSDCTVSCAAVRFDDPARDGQPEAGSAAGRARAPARTARRSSPGSRAESRRRCRPPRTRRSARGATRPTVMRAARGVARAGVGHQVDDDPFDLVAIGEHRRQIRRGVDVETQSLRLDLQPQRLGRLADEDATDAPARAPGAAAPDSIFDRSSSSRISRSSRPCRRGTPAGSPAAARRACPPRPRAGGECPSARSSAACAARATRRR